MSATPVGIYTDSVTCASILDSSTASLGTKDVGTFTHNLTGLIAGARYIYQFKATTTSGGNMSDIQTLSL